MLEQEQKEKQNKLYKKSVSELSTKTDLYNIFNYLINNNHSLYDDLAELDQILKDELGDKHPLLVGLIKKEWNEDVEYLDIKSKLADGSVPILPALMYLYLFNISSPEKK